MKLSIILILLLFICLFSTLKAQELVQDTLTSIELYDGTEYQGKITSENAETLTIEEKQGVKITIEKKTIQKRENFFSNRFSNSNLRLLPNRHRYFIMPSALNTQKKELTYRTNYFYSHNLEYGFTNNISGNIGFAFIFFNAGLQVSIPIRPKFRVGLGGTYFSTFLPDDIDNIDFAALQLVATYGTENRHISLGLLGLTSPNEDGDNLSMFTIGGFLQINHRWAILTENYILTSIGQSNDATDRFGYYSFGFRSAGKKFFVDFGFTGISYTETSSISFNGGTNFMEETETTRLVIPYIGLGTTF